MRQIEEAWGDLKRNQASFFLYVGLVVVFFGGGHFGQLFLNGQGIEGEAPGWAPVFSLFLDFYFAVVYSILLSIFFARIGEEIDRPLWKYHGAVDALKRFFIPWFILNLLMLTTIGLLGQAIAEENRELELLFTFGMFAGFLFTFPVGACIMHHGRLEWGELGVALAPIFRLFPQVLAVLFMGFMQFVLNLVAMQVVGELTLHSIGKYALFEAFAAVMDCLIFAMMWRVCISYRNYEVDNEPDYFDF